MWKYTGIKECNEFLLSLHLFDYKDKNKYIKTLYSISNRVEKNYKVYKIRKKNGTCRTIYEPSPLLKHIQSQILTHILEHRSISKYAMAYHKGISLKDNAIPHINQKKVLKLDIKNFFENISFFHVYQAGFPIEYFPKSVGMLFSYLCTYQSHLTQGAPTSPYLSNLVMKTFDEEIGSWCESVQISYTRYSDDMTFSGDFHPSMVIKKVRKLLYPLGLELNDKKTRVIDASSCQNVTGIVVNQKVQVCAKYRKKVRQEVYYIQKFGLFSHLKKIHVDMDKSKYLQILYGKILYVLQVNEEDVEFKKYEQLLEKWKANVC